MVALQEESVEGLQPTACEGAASQLTVVSKRVPVLCAAILASEVGMRSIWRSLAT